jgi:hypothetical protein
MYVYLVWTMKVAMLSTLTRMVLTTPEGTRISELVVALTRGQKFGPKRHDQILFASIKAKFKD